MFLYDTCEIVIDIRTDNNAILCLAVHRLRIDVVMLILVLNKPSVALKLLKVLGSLLINPRIVFARTLREIYLRLDYMIKRFLVSRSLSPGFVGIEHIVRTALHLFNQFCRRSDTSERFYNCHIRITCLCRISFGHLPIIIY